MSTLRRFRNRLKTSGILRRARSIRYRKRAESSFVTKKSRLRSIENSKKRERLYKLGKISER